MPNTASSFTFMHAADLHLASPLSGLAIKDEEVARRFAAASRQAFADLVTEAIEAAVGFVVIAGDVYDGDWKDNTIGLFFNREIARLHRASIPLFLLKGNHDAESVVTRTIPLPETVLQFSSNKAQSFRLEHLKVVLHGRSFADRAATENYALAYPAPLQGWFNIGVLHTSCTGRPGHAPYAPCTLSDLTTRGYQYWALGHVHEYEVVCRDPWVVFPGNLQGRSVRECGPKGAVIVQVIDGEVSLLRRVIVDGARWASINVSLEEVDAEIDALSLITKAIRPVAEEARGRLLALRLTLTGRTPLHRRLKSDARRFADGVQAVANHIGDDIWIERVRIETRDALEQPGPKASTSSFDLPTTLTEVASDPEVVKAADVIVAEIKGKLPDGLGREDAPAESDLAALLDEARVLVLGRTSFVGA